MIFRYGDFVFSNVEMLYAMIPIMIFLIYILTKDFMKKEQRLFNLRRKKIIVFFTKTIFFLLLLIAFLNPQIEYKVSQDNITSVKVLVDNSYSMQLYDMTDLSNTLDEINSRGISVDKEVMELGDYSSIGSSLLNQLSPGENVLLVSDGQNNFGSTLEDVSLFAASINARIFGLNLKEKKADAAIYIDGPDKVVSGFNNEYDININEVDGVGRKDVKVYLDEKLIYEGVYTEPIPLNLSFTSGEHYMMAVVEADERDTFYQNNVFYKTIKVYKTPKILFVTEHSSPLEQLYSTFYTVDRSDSLKEDLDSYYAVVLNDISATDLSDDDIERLDNYVADGNGLLVVGGKSAYDWGGYNTSLLSEILPVSVGQAAKKKDITNIVVLMDTGASSADEFTSGLSYFDIQKSLTSDIINSINPSNRLSIIEANYYLNTITPLSELAPKKDQLLNTLSLLTPTGFSELRFAYEEAHQRLRLNKGSKNIVIITDGKLVPQDQAATLNYVKQAYDDGIKTFIIGVGDNADEAFLQDIKRYGGGEYFRATEKDKIKIYFGNPAGGNTGDHAIFVYDSNHFITEDIKDIGSIYGFNTVYPKSTSRLLLTTTSGDPVLTVWNYGLGRVAALSTDDGTLWNPDMLSSAGSRSIIRTLNWLIEDPERKNTFVMTIPDLRIGENAAITVRSQDHPVSENLSFYEVSKGLYRANFYPKSTGFIDLLSSPAAVNYNREYQNIGMNPKLEKALKISGGMMLDDDPDSIINSLQSVSQVETIKSRSIAWWFLLGAIIIYLIEIFIRKMFELRYQR